MATTHRVTKKKLDPDPPANVVSQIEMLDFFRHKAAHELVIVEFAPDYFRVEAIIAWRVGRWTLMGSKGPLTYRGLNTLTRNLKTMGVGRTVIRLELLS